MVFHFGNAQPPADRVFLNEVKKCIEGCGGTSE
jgi:hypothetical protein